MAGAVDRLTAMIETPLNTEHLERRFTFVQTVLIVLLVVVIAVPFIASWWLSRTLPVVSTVKIENLHVLGKQALCPGDPLVTAYDFRAEGAGVLIRDATVWNVEPPKTMIFSTSRRFILDGPIEQRLTETYYIPRTYINYETGREEILPPGAYRRYFAISSPSRSTVIAIGGVEFSIKSDCGN